VQRAAKIFGIGLPKTGTVSLAKALTILGFRTVHNPFAFYRQVLEEADFNWQPDAWDALVHFGTRYYQQLDVSYPNSRFILTTRGREAWLYSCEQWWTRQATAGQNQDPDTYLSNMSTFGTRCFHKGQFGDIFDQHETAVQSWGAGIGNRFLVVNLDASNDEKSEALAQFLQVDAPPEFIYPHENKGVSIP